MNLTSVRFPYHFRHFSDEGIKQLSDDGKISNLKIIIKKALDVSEICFFFFFFFFYSFFYLTFLFLSGEICLVQLFNFGFV